MLKYIIRNNVPLLDEHTMRDEDGNFVLDFDEKKLQQIVDRNNKRIRATGDLIPLVIGHTKDGQDERDGPEIVGYADRLSVRPFRKTGKKAIHARFLFFKNKVGLARKFPRRSIELWLSDGKIDPISLLGATTPDRDLGLLQLEKTGSVIHFAAGGKRKYKRLLDAPIPKQGNTTQMDEKAIVAAVMKALEQSAVWKWADSKMKEEEAQAGEEDEMPLEGDEGLENEIPDEGLEGEPGLEEEESNPSLEEEEADERDGEEPVHFNMAASCPSGSNTSTPTFGARNRNPSTMHKKKPGTVNNSVSKMQRKRGGNEQLVRFQRQVGSLARENEKLRLKFQRSERERDLMELAAAGFDFDPTEELDYVTQLPDDHYAYHLNRIKKRYQRAPIGDARFDLSLSRNPTPQGEASGSRANTERVVSYATKKGISYEEALEELSN